jgi:predicted transporter
LRLNSLFIIGAGLLVFERWKEHSLSAQTPMSLRRTTDDENA